MNLGRYLRQIRNDVGETQKDFAKKLKITPASLNYLENGKRKAGPKVLKKISKELKIDIREVVMMNDENYEQE